MFVVLVVKTVYILVNCVYILARDCWESMLAMYSFCKSSLLACLNDARISDSQLTSACRHDIMSCCQATSVPDTAGSDNT